jgi:signal transduction histidine kinase/FixJ family two-component response regulator
MNGTAGQSSERRREPARVLVVDDEEAIRFALRHTLAHYGYSPIAVGLAEDAVREFEAHEFDVAILDIQLPKSDGVSLLEWIKSRSPRTEAIMLSAHGSIETAMSCVRAGAYDFIEKPYRIEKMIHTIERALEHQRLDRTSALFHAGQVIFATRDFDHLPEAVVKVSKEVMSADAVTLLLPGLDGTFYVAHAFGLKPEVEEQTRIAVCDGIAERVALARKPLVINGDASQRADLRGSTMPNSVRSSIAFPLVMADRVAGILMFDRFTDDVPYREADLETAAVLASQVLLALENSRLARQSATSEKLAAVGQLAAGIAHEINTPLQFVADSIGFLSESFADLTGLVDRYEKLRSRLGAGDLVKATTILLQDIDVQAESIDLAYLRDAMPKAFARASEGLGRVAEIVRAVKEFGRSDCHEKASADLKQCLQSTLTVCRSEYKYVADAVTEFGNVPPIVCHAGELNQVFLNLIVNAAHAIAEVVAGTERRGKISIRLERGGDDLLVSVEDTGAGIPLEVRARIFDPFFTTKAVGRGTGLGLSIARAIVEKHGGSLTFETEVGRGTKFVVRLPLEPRPAPSANEPAAEPVHA